MHSLNERLNQIEQGRLEMFIANALIDLARKIAKHLKAESTNDASTTRLSNFIAVVKDSQFKEMSIPPKFWPPLRNLCHVCRFFSLSVTY